MPNGIPNPGSRLSDAEKQRRSRKARQLRADAAMVPPGTRQTVVDSVLGFPALWDQASLEIAKVLLQHHEHLRDGRWGDQVMSYCHFEARLREHRRLLDAMDPVKARTEILLYEETTEGLPSSGLTKRYSEAQKVMAMDQEYRDMERLAVTMRRELGITPASWARMRAEMERKKGFDFALELVEDERDAG